MMEPAARNIELTPRSTLELAAQIVAAALGSSIDQASDSAIPLRNDLTSSGFSSIILSVVRICGSKECTREVPSCARAAGGARLARALPVHFLLTPLPRA